MTTICKWSLVGVPTDGKRRNGVLATVVTKEQEETKVGHLAIDSSASLVFAVFHLASR